MTLAQLWGVLRRIDNLAGLEAKHDKAIVGLRIDVDELKNRVTRLEAREDLVVAEAKAAAGTAAGVVVSSYLSDIARRVGMLEAFSGQSAPGRLNPS